MHAPPSYMPTPTRPSFAPNPHPSRPPTRLLSAVTLGVLAGHWAVLSGAPLALNVHSSQDTAPALTFTTRTLTAPVASLPAAVPARQHHQRVSKPIARAAPADTLQEPSLDAANESESTAATLAPEADAASPLANTTIAGPDAIVLAAANSASVSLGVDTPPKTPPLATAPPPPQYRYPAPVRLKYDVRGKEKGFPFFANGELLWQHDDTTYNARLEISIFLLGARVQTSVGQLTPQGLEPRRFGDKVRSEVAAHFERSKGKVIFSANTPDVPLQAGAQDNLSVLVQMASALAGASGQIPKGTQLIFQSVGPRSAEIWTFTVGALEKLALPGGDVSALHVQRSSSNESDGKADIWLAPSIDYMPVRILLTWAEDHFADQQWTATQKP